MGLQGKNTMNGASILVIDQGCDNDQLLVSLSKNGAKWLSPVGWTDQQKVALLDCRPNGERTEIDIPAEFARDIKTGDVLGLRCSELDLETEIIWEASEIETRANEDVVPVATGLAGGLLSRFKGAKPEVQTEIKSEAELRAEEADRAAQSYKAKMEAATAAKEDAQRKALEAAREAEAALKMEADRIAEMERAAKAFEEAERLKHDELRRVEEERRAEEARLAEEARRIEDARKREIAAQKEAERKAALESYEAALDISRDEEGRLKSRLKDLKHQAMSEASNMAIQQEDLKSRLGLLVTSEETVTKRFNSYEKNASALDEMNADLSLLQSETETLSADRQALSMRLSQADTDYQQAQKEAEAAMAKAEARRAELDHIRQEEGNVSGKIQSVSEKLSSQSQMVAEASAKTQKLQSKLDTAQAELAQARVEIEALEQALAVQAEQDQNLRLEIEATQQAIEDSQSRKAAHQDAIEHLEAGGALEDITDIDFQPRSYEAVSIQSETPEVALSADIGESTGLKDRMMGRVRRSFARDKDAQISIDVEDVVLGGAEQKTDPVLLAGLDDTPSFMQRHSSSLLALGAVIGGIAILGGGLVLNKSATPKLEVKTSTPAPTQVASVVSKVELAKAPEITNLEIAKEVKGEAEDLILDLPNIEVIDAASTKPETTKVEPAEIETKSIVKDAMTSSETEAEAFIVKLAEVVDPTGFAFELPDMQPISEPKKTDANPPPKKAKAVKETSPKKAGDKKPEVVKTAAVKKAETKKVPAVEVEVNYPELTSDVQTRLLELGFYNGEIDGLQNKATKKAITNFKTLFSMAETNSNISGALLTELKRAKREQEAAEVQAQAQADALAQAQDQAKVEAQASIQVANVAPAVTFYDTVQAVPSTPVVTDGLPATEDVSSITQGRPAYIAPAPEPAKVASIAPVISEPAPAPVVQDVIVEAKILKNASAKYPDAAQRKNYFVNVAIVVAYDIDARGRVTNLSIASNDHSGRFNEAFEKEALRAIERRRYKPKTMNGIAVESKGQKKRIVFRAE